LLTQRFPLVLFLFAMALMAVLIRPFFSSFFAALLLAVLLQPGADWLAVRLAGRRKLAAGLITILAALVIVLPIGITGLLVGKQVGALLDRASSAYKHEGLQGVVRPLPNPVDTYALWLAERSPVEWRTALFGQQEGPSEAHGDGAPQSAGKAPQGLSSHPAAGRESGLAGGSRNLDGQDEAPAGQTDSVPIPEPQTLPSTAPANGFDRGTLGTTAGYASNLLEAGFKLSVSVGLVFTALFFFLCTGDVLRDYLVRLIPMDDRRTLALLAELRRVAVGVFRATLITAVAQSAVAGVAYWIAGLSSPVLLILLTFIAALVPVVGAGSVVIAAGVLAILSDKSGLGLFLIVWGIIVVGLVDNLLKPILASDKVHLPSSLVFFSMICGIAVFGPLGLVAGPLVVSFFAVTARLAKLDKEQANHPLPSASS
jgi:predicted PurR-regulated permease PerM